LREDKTMIFTVQPTLSRPEAEPNRQPEPSLPARSKAVLARLDEASPLSAQLQGLTKDIGLKDRELMKLAGVSRATLARWRKEGEGHRPPPLDDLRAISVLLIKSGAMRPESVAGWLRSRNRGLSWHRPLEVLAQDDFSLVLTAAEAACGARIPVKKIPRVAEDDYPPFNRPDNEGARSPSDVLP
jgi:transcriptional regulator with XRE-family HTH domain